MTNTTPPAWAFEAEAEISRAILFDDKTIHDVGVARIIKEHAPDAEALAEALRKACVWVHYYSPTCDRDVSQDECPTAACAGLRDTLAAYRARFLK